MIYPKNFEQKLGFDKIRTILKANCLSNLGKEYAENMRFSSDYAKIIQQIDQTTEFQQILLFGKEFPTDFYIDMRAALHKIRIEGTFLTQTELFDLMRSLETVRSISAYFKNDEKNQYPNLKKLVAQLNIYPFIYEKISKIINKYGEIRDNASPELAQIRRELASKKSAISRKAHQVLKKAQEQGIVEPDVEISMRDGKMLIPVPANNKRKLKGFIYDESATGKTVYIEPAEAIELDNEIRELYFDEKREIIKILTEFSDQIRPYINDLAWSYKILGIIDFVRAKALFANSIEAIKPPIIEQYPHLKWVQARHPILYLNLKKENRKIVPLDIYFTQKNRIVLISGPNAGGKSVCLKTVGLLQYMLQCGMPVPLKQDSEAGIFKDIFVDIGDEQSIESDLSTYSSHLLNMKYFLKNSGAKSLILIDEFGTGTEPLLGGAIAEAVLEQLNKQKVFGVITTHYTNLKHYASNTKGIVNGAMLFDAQNLEPLYLLQIGKPGSSFAFEIAGKIGLPKNILHSATQKVGEEHINYDKNLKAIDRDRQYYEEKRRQIKIQEKKLEQLQEKLDKQLQNQLAEKKKIIAEAQKEAQEILKQLNKKIENTIFEIKQAQAEKEKTKLLRKDLNDFSEKITKKLENKDKSVLSEMERIKQRRLRKEKRKKEKQKTQPSEEDIVEEKEPLKEGDTVKIYGQNNSGIIEEIKGDTALVNFGNLKARLSMETLEKINATPPKPLIANSNKTEMWQPSKTSTDFLFTLDVRGMRGQEAIQTVAKYLDEAIVAQAGEIKILHGTGNGILRQLIREYLQSQDVVENVHDERIELGGAGITVVKLNYD